MYILYHIYHFSKTIIKWKSGQNEISVSQLSHTLQITGWFSGTTDGDRLAGSDACSNYDGGIDMCSYQSHEEVIKRLERLQAQYPNLVRVESLGKSVRGKDLVYAKLSENVARRSRGEPMFKFVANMHGDETLGRQMLLYLAEYLAVHYENDEVRHQRAEKKKYLMSFSRACA